MEHRRDRRAYLNNEDALEEITDRLRRLLREQVPDLLLQAECGGGLELPTPLPWGFASVPTLYELANTAERELQDLWDEQQRQQRQQEKGEEERAGRERGVSDQAHGDRPALAECGQAVDESETSPGGERRSGPGSWRGSPERSPPKQQTGGRVDGASGAPGEDGASGSPGGGGSDGAGSHGAGSRQRGLIAAADEGDREGARGSLGAGPREVDADASPVAATAAAAASTAAEDAGAQCPGDAGDAGPAHDTYSTEVAAAKAAAVSPPPEPPPPKLYACGAFLESLQKSRTFRSPHCEAAMAEAMGISDLYEGFAGSTLGPPAGRRQLEALRALLRDHINARWALEAVKQGVTAAKQGNYVDAHKAYARALELDPNSAEAYVARGAAHANQRAFGEAERDLRHALSLEPGHRNAAAYLQAVLAKVAEQRQQLEALEAERQLVMPGRAQPPEPPQRQPSQAQQQQRQARERGWERRRRAHEAGDAVERWAADPPGDAAAAAEAGLGQADSGNRVDLQHHSAAQGPSSAPGGLQKQRKQGVSWAAEGGCREGRRRRASDDGGSSGSENSGSSSGDSSGGTLGQGPSVQPGSDDIKRALEVVLKARKQKKKSKHKKHKKKHKKSKRRRRD